jgi:hypothetical protein
VFAGWVVGNDRPGAAVDQEQPEPVAVIGGIGSAQASWRQRFEQAAGNGRIAALTWRYSERDETAATLKFTA